MRNKLNENSFQRIVSFFVLTKKGQISSINLLYLLYVHHQFIIFELEQW